MQAVSRDELLTQLTFTAIAKDCPRFDTHPFKKDRCRECGHDVRAHRADAVSDEDILKAIANAQGTDGGHVILPSGQGLGELHLGGFMASGKAYVESRKITHVINAAKGLGSFFVGWSKHIPVLEQKGVVFLRLEWTDTHDQKVYREKPWDTLIEAIEFIENARKGGGNVVVHCAQGKSRSATVVVAYLMVKEGHTVDEALRFVQSKRPEADPNSSFMEQLREFRQSQEFDMVRSRLTTA